MSFSPGYTSSIPAPLGADGDDAVALTDERFIEEYLGSMTGAPVEANLGFLLQRSPSLGLAATSGAWPAKDAIVQPLGAADDDGDELPPPALPMMPDSPASSARNSQASSRESSRPPSVRRVRSYSTSDGHTEESFSPKNAALKTKHTASFSIGGGGSPLMPTMRVDAAPRSSHGSIDMTAGNGFDSRGQPIAIGGSPLDSSTGVSPHGSRGSSFSSPRISSYPYSPISPTMASASPRHITNRIGSATGSNPSTVNGSPSSGVTSIQSAHTRSITAGNLPVDLGPNSAISPHTRKIRLRGGNSSSPSSTLQHLSIPPDMDGLALGPGIGYLQNIHSSPRSAGSFSGGRSHGSSVASEGGVFEAGFTQLSNSSSFSSSSQSSQPLSPHVDESNLIGGGGSLKKTFKIKLVRQSHDGAYGMRVVEKPAPVDRVASVPEHVRSSGASAGGGSYAVQSTMFDRPAGVERVPSVPEGHVPSLSVLKISSPRHGSISITPFAAATPSQPLVPRPPSLTTATTSTSAAAAPGSAPSSAPIVEFSPQSPKSASSPMSAPNSGLLKGRGGQIKFVVSSNAQNPTAAAAAAEV
jgi:hypothetical protein